MTSRLKRCVPRQGEGAYLAKYLANSNSLNHSMPGSEYKVGMQFADKLRWGVYGGGGLILVLLGWTTWRNHRKYSAERAERRAEKEGTVTS